MRRVLGLVVVSAVTLLAGGCSESATVCGEEPASPRVEGTRLPVEISPRKEPPSADLTGEEIDASLPATGSGLMDQVQHRLMSETVQMAGALGDVRPGDCETTAEDEPGAGGRPYRCTVTYEGIEVVWKARVTGTDGSLTWFRAEPVTGVLRAQEVYQAAGWPPEEGAVWRCDRMPEIFRVPSAGQPTQHQCQRRLHECRSDDGGWRFWWQNMAATVDENGDATFVDPDSDQDSSSSP